MKFSLTVIGSGSGTPLPNRYSSAQVLNIHERFILIDCGEGTQINLRRFGINFNRIETILISHLHGDHFFGLPGLLNTFNQLGRTKDLNIIAHKKLKNILDILFNAAANEIKYKIIFHAVEDLSIDDSLTFNKYTISSFPLKHRIPTAGFLIKEVESRKKLSKSFISEYTPDISEIKSILNDNPFFDKSGEIVPPDKIFTPPYKPRTFAYISDSIFDLSLVDYIKNVDLLYHETTYSKIMKKLATQTMHSTTIDAATIAQKVNVGKLLIGHYSSRYRDTASLLSEAKEIFPNTDATFDGFKIDIPIDR